MRPLVLRLVTTTAVLHASFAVNGSNAASGVPFDEGVVSSPVTGGGYPGVEPAPGGCVRGRYDSNFSEGALALRPGTEQLVGASKAFSPTRARACGTTTGGGCTDSSSC